MSCTNPMPVTEDFSMYVPIAGSFWFTAYTYDLPLHARFTIEGEVYEPVVTYVDFGCETGKYGDSKLEEVVLSADGWGVEVPMKFEFERVYDPVDKVTRYDIEISDSYRELLAQFGVTYNVKAYVNIVVERAGQADIVPDDDFRSCIERTHWVYRPDTIVISQSTIDSVLTLPFADWQGDSVRIYWTGSKQEMALWLGNQCDFPMDQYDTHVVDYFRIAPNSYKDYSAADIERLIELNGKGGIYYARMLTTDSAAIIIAPKPIEGPLAEAIEMEKGTAYPIESDNTEQYYYFRKTWEDKPLQFAANTSDPITAYFGTTPDFAIDATDGTYLGSRVFAPTADGQALTLSMPEIEKYTKKGDMEFVFIRFSTATPSTITPDTWNTSTCVGNTVLLTTQEVLPMHKSTFNPTFRIKQEEWAKQDMGLCLSGITRTYFYLGDTCTFNLNASNKHVLFYQRTEAKDTLVLTQDTLRSMESRADADGYLYIQFMQGQTTGDMHIFPMPKQGTETGVCKTAADAPTVRYTSEGWLIETPTAETLYLYNAMGTLVSTWQQRAHEARKVVAPAAGMYILRSQNGATLLKH